MLAQLTAGKQSPDHNPRAVRRAVTIMAPLTSGPIEIEFTVVAPPAPLCRERQA
jgi:hypothetical protein